MSLVQVDPLEVGLEAAQSGAREQHGVQLEQFLREEPLLGLPPEVGDAVREPAQADLTRWEDIGTVVYNASDTL